MTQHCKTLQDCHRVFSYGMVKKLLPPDTSHKEIERQQLFFAPNEHGVSPAETALKEILEHMERELQAVSKKLSA
jgi:hypothetical protein